MNIFHQARKSYTSHAEIDKNMIIIARASLRHREIGCCFDLLIHI